jgi:hypothetical protein
MTSNLCPYITMEPERQEWFIELLTTTKLQ